MDGIKIEVTGNIARIIERPARITAGTVGLPVEFSFDSAWDGLSKTAVFRMGKIEMVTENLVEETTVPWELLQHPGKWLSIGVYGVNADGSVAIPTIWANVCAICESATPDGDPSTDPTLPVWQRILDMVGNLLGLNTNAKGNLVEAVNEAHNIALAGGIESDPTLTKSGKAADAKVTGDALATKLNSADLRVQTENALKNQPVSIAEGGTGANNALVALGNLGGVSRTLLWENDGVASMDGNFAINLPINGISYEGYEVVFSRANGTKQNLRSSGFVPGDATSFSLMYVDLQEGLFERAIVVSNHKMVVSPCANYPWWVIAQMDGYSTPTPSVASAYCIPVYVYGIKGVK